MQRERGEWPRRDPAAADSDSDDQPGKGAERDQATVTATAAAFASTRRERSIGWASVSPRMPASSSPAVERAATEIPYTRSAAARTRRRSRCASSR